MIAGPVKGPKMKNGENSREGLSADRAQRLVSLIEPAPGAIVSRELAKSSGGTVTLFAFDEGQALSEHSAPFDALVQVLDGELLLTIGGTEVPTAAGQMTLMPANVPHALRAPVPAKMLLTMLKSL